MSLGSADMVVNLMKILVMFYMFVPNFVQQLHIFNHKKIQPTT